MSLKIICTGFSLFVLACSPIDPVISEKPPQDLDPIVVDFGNMQDLVQDIEADNGPMPPDLSHCVSDFSSCDAAVTLVVSQSNGLVPFVAVTKFEDGTSLVFDLEGEAETLVGDIRLADASKGRPFPPMAGLVQPLEKGPNGEIREIVWDSLGETIQVSFPRPDFMKIIYDVELFDRLDLDRPHRFLKGEFIAPISVRCYTGVPGSGNGVRDSDFSSEFCQKYIKHNHRFPPSEPIDDD